MSNAELFIEVRCEELPARFAEPAREGLVAVVTKLLKGIEHGEIRSWGTPRRIAIAVANVATERPVEEKVVTGPPEAAAFRDGAPTPAAIGFAKSKGIDVEDAECKCRSFDSCRSLETWCFNGLILVAGV